jgi:DNA-binding MarR family transcriptional regulator
MNPASPRSPRADSSTHLIIALLHERSGAMTLTSQEIAALTHRTRRSITAALAQLEDAGVILVDRRRRNPQDRSGRRIRLAGGTQ